MANEVAISLVGNQVKVFHTNAFQKINPDDFDRFSGANPEHSIVPAILTAILAAIGQAEDTYIGFGVTTDGTNIEVDSGIIIRPDTVFRFPAVSLIPNPDALAGIYEILLDQSLTDPAALMLWDTAGKSFQPGSGPTRKTNEVKLFEQWVPSLPAPSPTTGRVGLLHYKRDVIGGPITEATLLLPVYDPQFLGVGVGLNPAIGDRTTLTNAINWLFNYVEAKDFIRTVPSAGFDNAKFQVRTQGNYAYWTNDEGVTWRPFA
ncbi:hypothetical protein EHO57_13845 [Leptospira langatensis]|uniref:Uncharacterized protein n=1 Tax=Leptospira langatensis TaxID=2484983 RepID=A0A5R2ATQ7_9LEPT|nr:hypothetical protein [Leptospira langatensis]TGJ99839.1 hypothetical protein EHO57_13845 [Leptospira langatensis]